MNPLTSDPKAAQAPEANRKRVKLYAFFAVLGGLLAAALTIILLLPKSNSTNNSATDTSKVVATSGGVVHKFNWEINSVIDSPDGFTRSTYGINGKPGYMNTINVTEGDTIQVTVKNALDLPTSIHWHGIRQLNTNYMDGPVGVTQCPIKPGASFTYTFLADTPGNYWWHGHYHTQYVDGLRGALIVHPKVDPYAGKYDEEIVVQLADWYHQQGADLEKLFLDPNSFLDSNEPVWSSGLINGNGRFNCTAAGLQAPSCVNNHTWTKFNFVPGKTYKLRFINTDAFAAFGISLDKHQMQVIEADNVVLDGSLKVTQLRINVAQRYTVLVKADQTPGTYHLKGRLLDNSPWTSLPLDEEDPGLKKTAIAVVKYAPGGTPNPNPQNYTTTVLDVTAIKPLNPIPVPAPTKRINFEFTIGQFPGDPGSRAWITFDGFKTNNTYRLPDVPTLVDLVQNKKKVAQLPANSNVQELKKGDVVEITIINHDGGEHPMHLHGHDFWVIAQGTATSAKAIPNSFSVTTPPQRDTVTMAASPCKKSDPVTGICVDVGYTVIRFVADNPGVWTFHCHIDWHLLAGLAMTFVSDLPGILKNGIPADALALC